MFPRGVVHRKLLFKIDWFITELVKKYRVYTRYTTREADRRTQIQTLVVESRCICAFTWTTQTCMLAKECNWILLLSADIVTCRTRAGLHDSDRLDRHDVHRILQTLSRDFIATPTKVLNFNYWSKYLIVFEHSAFLAADKVLRWNAENDAYTSSHNFRFKDL